MKVINPTLLFIVLVFFCANSLLAAIPIEEHHVRIDKHNVYYNTVGKGDKVILFLHGLFADKEQWIPLMEYFSDRGYYTVAPDLPGYGKSSDYPLSVYTIENQVILIKELVDEIGIKNINLAGNSLGCAVAIAFTEKYMDDVKTLALLGGPAGLGKWSPEIMKAFKNGTNPFVPLSENEFKKEMQLLFFHPPEIPLKTVKRIVAGYKKSLDKYICIFNIFNLSIYNFTVNFNISFRKPTLIVWGKEDKILTAADAKAAQKKMPGSKLELLDNAGHLLMIENAKEVAGIYFKFLNVN